jgi:uncharacterized protein YndB with AHSA1/START domain
MLVSLLVAADRSRYPKALTQQDEIAHWWTDDLDVKPEVGSLAVFRFHNGAFVIQLEVAELDEGSKVHQGKITDVEKIAPASLALTGQELFL